MKRALLLILVIAVAATPAGADMGRARDRRDTKGPMDIRRIGHGHGTKQDGTETIRHSIRSHGGWKSRRLNCGGGSSKCRSMFNIYFDTDHDDTYERQVQIYRRDGTVYAGVIRYDEDCAPVGTICTESSNKVGNARVWRANRRSIAFSMPVAWLGRGIRSYKWHVNLTFFRDSPCPENSGTAPSSAPRDYYCVDYAPQYYGSDTPGWLKHRL